jgi:NAD+ synthase
LILRGEKVTLVDKISSWIKERTDEAGSEGVVLGLSGGLDSSVAAVLCKKALGERVLGLILPCESNPEDEKDVLNLADKFNIKTEKIDLGNLFNSFLEILPEKEKLARANLKPRLRMIVLYYYANNLNYLVAGCSNKSEVSVGYFTKYGDGAADILPLGELLKSEVRELAKTLDIPKEIIEKTPSAGLWEGQTDEDELGISYEELDKAIRAIEERREEKFSDPQTIEKVKRMISKSEHKRKNIPVYEEDKEG